MCEHECELVYVSVCVSVCEANLPLDTIVAPTVIAEITHVKF